MLTGTRAEYGLLRPVIAALCSRPEFDVSLLATGMHLAHEFGHTIDEIRRDGYPIGAEVDVLLAGDTHESMVKSMGLAILTFPGTLKTLKPDVVLLYGDRFEALAGAIVAGYMHIPVAHMHGGDSAAGFDIDDANRHAITKFAHIHLAATEAHAERIRRMGENPRNVHVVGSPALDTITQGAYTPPDEIARKFSLDLTQPLLLICQHPVTSEAGAAQDQMDATLRAIEKLRMQTVWIFPNADPGGRGMIRTLARAESLSWVRVEKSVPHADFLGLIGVSSAMVGNSSSALIEAPSFHVPAVNIGSRQSGRDRTLNVIDAAYDEADITSKIKQAVFDQAFRASLKAIGNPYGDGKTATRVADILASAELGSAVLQKPWFS